ncbi:Gfo/Idh/MocA family protein [Myxococcus vastator]|uniref:Gfo/Idh/MocA family protein n=1 Tax=Myxococcus vastator TaxID=2709664 RepID=UPI0019684A04|nr:Gfo/Idh/MocA family oxidoreductase [Myxococcus vastator]
MGFIGAGEQGRANLIPALLQVDSVEIVAVCDRERQRAASLGSLARGAEIFSSPEAMVAASALDAVVMACPPQAHLEVARHVIPKGIHVFVEKPPCVTTSELKSLISLAKEHEVVTGVGVNFRFATPVRRLREVVENELFGQLVHLQIQHPANKPKSPMWESDSTIRSFLLAQAIHAIDLAISFGGELSLATSRHQHADGSVLIHLNLEFTNGLSATLLTGNMFPSFAFEMRAIGSRSNVATLDNLWNLTVIDSGKQGRFSGDGKRWREVWQPSPLDSGYARSGYVGELQAFAQAIRAGTRFEADFEALLPTYHAIDVASESTLEETKRSVANE